MKRILRRWAAKLTEPDDYDSTAWSDAFVMWTGWAVVGAGMSFLFAPELRYILVGLVAALLAVDVWLALYIRGQRSAAKAAETEERRRMSTEPEKLTPAERELLAGVPAEAWYVCLTLTDDAKPHMVPVWQDIALCGERCTVPDVPHRPFQLLANMDALLAGYYCPDCIAKFQSIARAALKALGGEVGAGG